MNSNISMVLHHIIMAEVDGNNVKDLRKAAEYLEREIRNLEGRPDPNQLDLLNKGENNDES